MKEERKQLTKEQLLRIQKMCLESDEEFFWEQMPESMDVEELAEFLNEFPDFMKEEKESGDLSKDTLYQKIIKAIGEE